MCNKTWCLYFFILKRFFYNTNKCQWKKKLKLRKIIASLNKMMLALAQKIITILVITFWFQGVPWNHHNLYPVSHISFWTPEITYRFGINWNQNPAHQVILCHKLKFNQVLISGNFNKLDNALWGPESEADKTRKVAFVFVKLYLRPKPHHLHNFSFVAF